MKKITALFAIGLFAYPLLAQENSETSTHSEEYEQCTNFFKTPPLKELLKNATPVSEDYNYEDWEPKDRKEKPDYSGIVDHGIPSNGGVDPALQSTNGWRDGSKMMKENWQGMGGAFPPDPTGAAGYDYFVQAVNSTYRIYQKDGTPETPPYTLASIWPGSSADGDPIVMYDRYADRWFISQFQVSSNEILIAISETADPLGSYYLYEFTFPSFPDYPKYGVWSNAYYMTANTSGPDCIAFERDKMLVGDPTAGKINMYFPSFYQFFNSVAPIYAEGETAPEPDESGYFFAVQDDSWPGITQDGIKILKADINWVSGSGDVNVHQDLATDDFNSVFTTSWNDITQKGTSQKLDAVTGIFMYRAQYRRFANHNTVMLCHTVDVGANRAAVRWYELRENNDGVFYVYQQGTYSPDAVNSRWMGSIAMDAQGNIALAYCFAGSNEYAGIRYTGRFKDDPLGEMTVQEQIAVEGEGAQTGGNRYGDYSQMTMDPSDDMTFWFTGEYLGTSGARRTRIFSFSSWHLVGTDDKSPGVPLFKAYQPNPSIVRLTWNDIVDANVQAEIYNAAGQLIKVEQINTADQQRDIEVPNFVNGIYLVKLVGENTNLTRKVYIGH